MVSIALPGVAGGIVGFSSARATSTCAERGGYGVGIIGANKSTRTVRSFERLGHRSRRRPRLVDFTTLFEDGEVRRLISRCRDPSVARGSRTLVGRKSAG